MKLTIAKDELNRSIQLVSRAISSRSPIQILSGIKIEADSSSVTLTASDTEISIQSHIPHEREDELIFTLEQGGSIVLPAKFFVEIIRKLPADDVEIEVKENHLAVIRSGSSEIQLVGFDPEEYPVLPQLEAHRKLAIDGELLKSMIRQTSFAVSTNESTPILTGVLCTWKQHRLKFIATDRHRLSAKVIPLEASPEQEFEQVVISGKILNELIKIIPDEPRLIEVVIADNQVLFKLESTLFYARLLDGTFPDTSKIIPTNYRSELVLPYDGFIDAIERAYLLSREEKTNIVRLITLENGLVEISSSSNEIGKVTEQLAPGTAVGDPVKISFNSKYMLDALRVMDCEEVHIGFTGAMSPIILRPQGEEGQLHLILPYRTTN